MENNVTKLDWIIGILLLILIAVATFNACDDQEPCDFVYELWWERALLNCEVTETQDCKYWQLISREDVIGCHLEQGRILLSDSTYYRYVHRNNVRQ